MLEVIIRPIRISYLSTIIYNNKLGGKFWSCDNYISTDRFNFLVERPANRQLRLGINSNSNIIHFLFNVFSFNWSRFAFCGFWFPWQCSNDSSSKWPSIMSFPLHSFLLPFILYFSLSLFPHSFCFFFLFFYITLFLYFSLLFSIPHSYSLLRVNTLILLLGLHLAYQQWLQLLLAT